MQFNSYAIFDSKVGAFLTPFFLRSHGEAIRVFQTLANDPEHQFCKYAADFTLFCIGTFDDATGIIQSSVHENLGTALIFQRIRQMPRQLDLVEAINNHEEQSQLG